MKLFFNNRRCVITPVVIPQSLCNDKRKVDLTHFKTIFDLSIGRKTAKVWAKLSRLNM